MNNSVRTPTITNSISNVLDKNTLGTKTSSLSSGLFQNSQTTQNDSGSGSGIFGWIRFILIAMILIFIGFSISSYLENKDSGKNIFEHMYNKIKDLIENAKNESSQSESQSQQPQYDGHDESPENDEKGPPGKESTFTKTGGSRKPQLNPGSDFFEPPGSDGKDVYQQKKQKAQQQEQAQRQQYAQQTGSVNGQKMTQGGNEQNPAVISSIPGTQVQNPPIRNREGFTGGKRNEQELLNNSLNGGQYDNYYSSSSDQPQYIADDSYSTIQMSKSASKSGWCYIGEDRGFRSCIDVGDNDTCMSGDIFPTQAICVNPNLRM